MTVQYLRLPVTKFRSFIFLMALEKVGPPVPESTGKGVPLCVGFDWKPVYPCPFTGGAAVEENNLDRKNCSREDFRGQV